MGSLITQVQGRGLQCRRQHRTTRLIIRHLAQIENHHWRPLAISLDKARFRRGEIGGQQRIQRRIRLLSKLRQALLISACCIQFSAGAHRVPQLMHHARLELYRGVAPGLIRAFQLYEKTFLILRQRDVVLCQFIQQDEQLAGDTPQVGVGKPAACAQCLIQGGGAAGVGDNG